MNAVPLVAAVLALMLMARVADGQPPKLAENPVLPNGADPHAMVVGNEVWIYPTFTVGREQAFFAFVSKDLVTWQRRGPILRFSNVKWINADGNRRHHAWAPCAIERNAKFYFYYSVGDQNTTPSRIGVAVGRSPSGPFIDSGKELPCTGAKDVFEAIDPMAFTDPVDGKSYLYCGGSNGSKLRVFELNDDMVSFAREVEVATPPQFTEGAFMHERNGLYYLSYSHGGWRDASYSVHYATAASPTGPWQYRGPILSSDDRHKGPGHHSFIQNAATGQWYIVYHRWNDRAGDGPYDGVRSTCIDTMEYEEDGTIKPILMTDAGVAATTFGPAK